MRRIVVALLEVSTMRLPDNTDFWRMPGFRRMEPFIYDSLQRRILAGEGNIVSGARGLRYVVHALEPAATNPRCHVLFGVYFRHDQRHAIVAMMQNYDVDEDGFILIPRGDPSVPALLDSRRRLSTEQQAALERRKRLLDEAIARYFGQQDAY